MCRYCGRDLPTKRNVKVRAEENESILVSREALEALRKAADQGNAEAQRTLGWMYFDGEGVPRDMKEAENLFRKAGAQGDEDALRMIRHWTG